MVIIGVTGGFGTGKSRVANFFAELGAKLIDADKIAHNIIRRNSPAFQKIVLNFGKGILSKNKSIDRRKLADKVFNNKRALKLLCEITHPFIISKIKKKLREIEKVDPSSIVVIDAPLLIEAGLNKIVDYILVVDATAFNQLKRSIARRGMSEDEVKQRIKMQLPLALKRKLADYVIDNNNTLLNTKRQVERIWRRLTKEP